MLVPHPITERPSGEQLDWAVLLREATGRFAAVIAAADLAARVPSCPGWKLHDLAEHLGGVHHWAAHAIEAGSPDADPPSAPEGREALVAWYRRQALHLADVLDARGPDAPAWTFGPGPHTAAFWYRRQVHEATMHAWDAESATGAARRIDAAVAWDGVGEVVDVFYPRQVQLGRTAPLPRGVRLLATDLGEERLLGEGDPVEVAAPADVLLRLLWHRADPAAEGVDAEAAALLASAVTP